MLYPLRGILTADWVILTADCRLPTAYCLLPIAYCLLPIAYCLLPTADCLLPTAYCLLPTAYCLLHNCLLPELFPAASLPLKINLSYRYRRTLAVIAIAVKSTQTRDGL